MPRRLGRVFCIVRHPFESVPVSPLAAIRPKQGSVDLGVGAALLGCEGRRTQPLEELSQGTGPQEAMEPQSFRCPE